MYLIKFKVAKIRLRKISQIMRNNIFFLKLKKQEIKTKIHSINEIQFHKNEL